MSYTDNKKETENLQVGNTEINRLLIHLYI